MIVYAIIPDSGNIKRFVMPPIGNKNRAGDIGDFDTGVKKSDNWVPLSIEWFSDNVSNLGEYKDPDISYIFPGSFILSPRTRDLVGLAISDVVELLPLLFNNETWYLLNVFNKVDAMDKANSRYKIYRSGKVGWLITPAFFANKIPHNKLFKIPEDPATIYFAEHHPDDSEDNFKNIVEKNNLFGIKFVKVWES